MKLWKLLDSSADLRIQDEVILAYKFKVISVIKACLLLHRTEILPFTWQYAVEIWRCLKYC